jgi:6-pyruvoyltetrahydropterin/6-carboxytetrahydropterin synthase
MEIHMITVTKRLEWDAGHRLVNHESLCKNLHGHRYAAEITVQALQLDAVGRVIDFGVIKQRVGEWINTHWDHGLLLKFDDPLVTAWPGALEGNKTYFFNNNPTAEVIAETLAKVCDNLLGGDQITIVKVRVYETPTCWADYTPPVKDWFRHSPIIGPVQFFGETNENIKP